MPRWIAPIYPVLGAVVLLAIGFLCLAPAGAAQAASQAILQVDRLDDPALPEGAACTAADNDCTLRGAIAQAVDGDTIQLAITGTIVLSQGQLVITESLTISGVNMIDSRIDGDDAYRIFNLQSNPAVHLDRLTLQNGSTGADGGAVHMRAGTLTMTHVRVQDNRAQGVGGGLYMLVGPGQNANGSFSNVTFRNNRAMDGFQSGGAVSMHSIGGGDATLVIEESRLEGNVGGSPDDGYGGAISASAVDRGANVSLHIRNTAFISNTTRDYGGAIYLSSYNRDSKGSSPIQTRIENSRFVGNQAQYGGAIYQSALDSFSAATLAISNTTFASNTATTLGDFGSATGGALHNDSYNRGNDGPTSARLSVYGSTFSHNTASDGGALYNSAVANAVITSAAEALATLTNSTFSQNRAEFKGGGIRAQAARGVTSTVSAVTTTHVTMVDNVADEGHSIASDHSNRSLGPVFLHNSLLLGEEATACLTPNDSITGTNNLISDGSCGNGVPFRLGTPMTVVHELADNSGPTLTHSLYKGSNALNAVPAGECTVAGTGDPLTMDQRGQPRPFGAACDIGALEAQTTELPEAPEEPDEPDEPQADEELFLPSIVR